MQKLPERKVHVRETQASLLKKMLKLVTRYCLNYLTRDLRLLVHNMLR